VKRRRFNPDAAQFPYSLLGHPCSIFSVPLLRRPGRAPASCRAVPCSRLYAFRYSPCRLRVAPGLDPMHVGPVHGIEGFTGGIGADGTPRL